MKKGSKRSHDQFLLVNRKGATKGPMPAHTTIKDLVAMGADQVRLIPIEEPLPDDNWYAVEKYEPKKKSGA